MIDLWGCPMFVSLIVLASLLLGICFVVHFSLIRSLTGPSRPDGVGCGEWREQRSRESEEEYGLFHSGDCLSCLTPEVSDRR
jgi:hypothetical protein